jgi:hypothetical protein
MRPQFVIAMAVATAFVAAGVHAAGWATGPTGALPADALVRQRAQLSKIPPAAQTWVAAESARIVDGALISGVQSDVKRQYPKLTASGVNAMAFLALMAADEELRQRASSSTSNSSWGSSTAPSPQPMSEIEQLEQALSNVERTFADMSQADVQNLKQ